MDGGDPTSQFFFFFLWRWGGVGEAGRTVMPSGVWDVRRFDPCRGPLAGGAFRGISGAAGGLTAGGIPGFFWALLTPPPLARRAHRPCETDLNSTHRIRLPLPGLPFLGADGCIFQDTKPALYSATQCTLYCPPPTGYKSRDRETGVESIK